MSMILSSLQAGGPRDQGEALSRLSNWIDLAPVDSVEHRADIVARSPDSVAAFKLLERSGALASGDVTTRCLFLISPEHWSRSALLAFSKFVGAYGEDYVAGHVRIANYARAGNLHEQVRLGNYGVWIGGQMKGRSAGQTDVAFEREFDPRAATWADAKFDLAYAMGRQLSERRVAQLADCDSEKRSWFQKTIRLRDSKHLLIGRR